MNGSEDLGSLFFIAEFATAVAGWVLEINPFDQPNVAEAKEATKRVLAAGPLPSPPFADDAALRALLSAGAPGNYIALMGYLEPSVEFDEEISALRATLGARPTSQRPSATGRASCTRPVSCTRVVRRWDASFR